MSYSSSDADNDDEAFVRSLVLFSSFVIVLDEIKLINDCFQLHLSSKQSVVSVIKHMIKCSRFLNWTIGERNNNKNACYYSVRYSRSKNINMVKVHMAYTVHKRNKRQTGKKIDKQ